MFESYLHSLHLIYAHHIDEIIDVYGTVEEGMLDRFSQLTSGIWPRVAPKLPQTHISQHAQDYQDKLNTSGITYVAYKGPGYPASFHDLKQVPAGVFVRGDVACLTKPSLTVVGARNLNSQTPSLLDYLLKDVVSKGVGIWSGLAYGVDTESHKQALMQSWTGAAIGSGVNDSSIYPAINRTLAHSIIEKGGVLISEYPPGTGPETFHFPQRNRLLAALGTKTLVIQAKRKSGSLITVEYAREIGKEVMTTPAFPFLKDFEGNNNLIKKGLATTVTSAEDILSSLDMLKNGKSNQFQTHDSEKLPSKQKKVFDVLHWQPLSVEEISAKTHVPVSQTHIILTQLEMHGLVANAGGNEWIKS